MDVPPVALDTLPKSPDCTPPSPPLLPLLLGLGVPEEVAAPPVGRPMPDSTESRKPESEPKFDEVGVPVAELTALEIPLPTSLPTPLTFMPKPTSPGLTPVALAIALVNAEFAVLAAICP